MFEREQPGELHQGLWTFSVDKIVKEFINIDYCGTTIFLKPTRHLKTNQSLGRER
jgi:hypothetical protein